MNLCNTFIGDEIAFLSYVTSDHGMFFMFCSKRRLQKNGETIRYIL